MMPWREELRSMAEPAYAEFASSLIPGRDDLIGVRIPGIRRLLKRILKDDWRSVLESGPECFEEEMLMLLIVATAPIDIEERIRLESRFIHLIDNWSLCDTYCGAFGFTPEESQRAWDHLRGLIHSGMEYPMRMSVVARMMHFTDRGSMEVLMRDIIENRHDGYYYKMGCAWAVATCHTLYPDIGRRILESQELEIWIHNKSIQKIRESLRVPAEEKDFVKGLRRKAP